MRPAAGRLPDRRHRVAGARVDDVGRAEVAREAEVALVDVHRHDPARAEHPRAATTFRPIPPQPITATSEPTSIFAVFMTAPKPVITAQPTSAARSAGTFGSYLTRLRSCITAYSAITPTPENTLSALPAASRVRCVPSNIVYSALPC